MNIRTFYPLLLVPLLFVLLLTASAAQAQVSIAPTMVFIHDNTNMNEIYVTNTSSTPQELNVSLRFGYPSTNEEGSVSMRFDDEERQARYGVDQNVRVFPRRLVLQPGESQTLRFQVMPMADRPDGMYWARAVIASRAVTPDVDDLELAEGEVGARVGVVFEQDIPLFYRKGNTTTGVIVHQVFSDIDEERLVLRPHVSRDGNSPFLGTVQAEMFDSDGNMVQSTSRNAFFYFEEYRRLEIPVEELAPGRYRVDLHFDTQRRDISARDLVQAERQTHTIEVDI